jgi:RHS repeat-associated protein
MSWHSKAQDPTGLIWMGARYYDPQVGRFISPDPIGYPINIDLYAYADGDPINNFDPDGRFASSMYQTVKSTVFSHIQANLDAHSQGYERGYTDGNSFQFFASDPRSPTAISFSYALGKMDGYIGATLNILSPKRPPGLAIGEVPFPGSIASSVRAAISGNGVNITRTVAVNAKIANDWAQLSGALRQASKGKGNFGIGSATREQADAMGKAWVGSSYHISSDGKALISADGMRQYRSPILKPDLGKTQANFQRRFEGQKRREWQSNGHLDILD